MITITRKVVVGIYTHLIDQYGMRNRLTVLMGMIGFAFRLRKSTDALC